MPPACPCANVIWAVRKRVKLGLSRSDVHQKSSTGVFARPRRRRHEPHGGVGAPVATRWRASPFPKFYWSRSIDRGIKISMGLDVIVPENQEEPLGGSGGCGFLS